jgi:probable phosphoglycerate mutase
MTPAASLHLLGRTPGEAAVTVTDTSRRCSGHDPTGSGVAAHRDRGEGVTDATSDAENGADGAPPRLALAAWRSGPAALWLVRHGQSEGNVVRDEAERRQAPDYVLGCRDADVPLSPLGRRQATAFGRWLAEQPAHLHPDAVLVSPYLRAVQTADLLLGAAGLLHLPRGVDERLRDREMGEWDGLTWRGIVARHPEEAERAEVVGRYFHRPPGGESWTDICLRLRSLLADATRELAGARLLVVAHDVVIQLTRAVVEGLDERATVELVTTTAYANCGLTVFEHDTSGPRLDRYNWTVPVREHGEPETRSSDAPVGR